MGFATILGGALSGLGKGMTQQAEMDWNARREAALERLRSENRRAEMGQQSLLEREEMGVRADLEDRNAGRSDTRRTQGQLAIDTNRARADEAKDARQFKQTLTLKQVDASNAKSMAILNSTLDRAETREAIQLKNDIDKGEVVETLTGSNGNYWGRRRDGSVVDTGVKYATTSDRKGDEPGSGGTLAEVIARKNGGAQPKATDAKSFTRAEAEQAARARGIPVDTAIRMLQQAGGKLVD